MSDLVCKYAATHRDSAVTPLESANNAGAKSESSAVLFTGHDKSAPERSRHSIAQGPRRPKEGHDRLMHTVDARTPAPESLCPACGERVATGTVFANDLHRDAHYLCTQGHIFIVRWMGAV